MYKLKTVDVWDTILRRKCHPEAIKLLVARKISIDFDDQLRPEFASHWEVYSERLEIERNLATKNVGLGRDEEYILSDVIETLLKNILKRPLSAERANEKVNELIEFEVYSEIQNTYVDSGIKEFLSQTSADKTIFLSDFYMPKELIWRILHHHGVDDLIDDGVVSCDIGLNKRSGRLYAYIHENYDVSPEEHIHIGDNYYVDVETPSKMRVMAQHYIPEKEHSERSVREELFNTRAALFSHLRETVCIPAEISCENNDETARRMFALGVDAAPLFIGFALFIAEQCLKDGIHKCYFLTREGDFFSRVFRSIFPNKEMVGSTLPDDRLLFVSRYSTFVGSMEEISLEEMKRVWSLNWQQTPDTLLGILHFSGEERDKILKRNELSGGEIIDHPERNPGIARLFEDADFLKSAERIRKEERARLSEYLKQVGIFETKRVALADIGWRGTIQDNLARLAPKVEFVGYYLSLRKFLNPQPSNTVKRAYGPDERVEDVSSFSTSFEPLEMLCNSEYGTVVGYSADKHGDVRPILANDTDECSNTQRYVNPFQRGVLAACELWQPYIHNHAVSSAEIRPIALQIWERIAGRPPKELLAAYYNAPQNDLFGYGGLFDRSRAPTLTQILCAPFLAKPRRELIQYIRRTQWAPAVSALPVSPLHKLALHALYWLAHKYKRFRVIRFPKGNARSGE
ncbi:hypothetical protein T8J41_00710 [Nitratireductor rhodophyticola]|uniref:hypothetical protein n=1 Tax=Nitratireductor rhodophyticola TaxID=2854036 RepID=UPI002AC9A49B|nr:hypothetical protein [Nitratireductor rhodophyticola]WPZ14392.1 hypothetical protein T8J41_00710 [Nitratireductor rhodophyticola]